MTTHQKFWIFAGFMAGIVMAFLLSTNTSCIGLRDFDQATGTFQNTNSNYWPWEVNDRDEAIIKSLEANGKICIIVEKEENKWADWILGAVMCLGGLGMAGGAVWLVYNLIYLGGKYMKSGILAIVAGVLLFGGAYVLMEYLWVLTGLLIAAMVGGLVWLIWYIRNRREEAEAAVNSIQIARYNEDSKETQDDLRKVQGKHQPFFKKLKDELYPK